MGRGHAGRAALSGGLTSPGTSKTSTEHVRPTRPNEQQEGPCGSRPMRPAERSSAASSVVIRDTPVRVPTPRISAMSSTRSPPPPAAANAPHTASARRPQSAGWSPLYFMIIPVTTAETQAPLSETVLTASTSFKRKPCAGCDRAQHDVQFSPCRHHEHVVAHLANLPHGHRVCGAPLAVSRTIAKIAISVRYPEPVST